MSPATRFFLHRIVRNAVCVGAYALSLTLIDAHAQDAVKIQTLQSVKIVTNDARLGGTGTLAHTFMAGRDTPKPTHYRAGASSDLSTVRWQAYSARPAYTLLMGTDRAGCPLNQVNVRVFFQVRYAALPKASTSQRPTTGLNELTGSGTVSGESNVVSDAVCVGVDG